MSRWAEPVWKLKIPKLDKNDILVLALEIECACNASTSNGLECLICSIAIERTSIFTHGVIPGQSHTEALRISSPGIDEAHLLGPATTGELQWSIMSDWTFL
jgi:hypothetical protein